MVFFAFFAASREIREVLNLGDVTQRRKGAEKSQRNAPFDALRFSPSLRFCVNTQGDKTILLVRN
jgi:hypothetical protein